MVFMEYENIFLIAFLTGSSKRIESYSLPCQKVGELGTLVPLKSHRGVLCACMVLGLPYLQRKSLCRKGQVQ